MKYKKITALIFLLGLLAGQSSFSDGENYTMKKNKAKDGGLISAVISGSNYFQLKDYANLLKNQDKLTKIKALEKDLKDLRNDFPILNNENGVRGNGSEKLTVNNAINKDYVDSFYYGEYSIDDKLSETKIQTLFKIDDAYKKFETFLEENTEIKDILKEKEYTYDEYGYHYYGDDEMSKILANIRDLYVTENFNRIPIEKQNEIKAKLDAFANENLNEFDYNVKSFRGSSGSIYNEIEVHKDNTLITYNILSIDDDLKAKFENIDTYVGNLSANVNDSPTSITDGNKNFNYGVSNYTNGNNNTMSGMYNKINGNSNVSFGSYNKIGTENEKSENNIILGNNITVEGNINNSITLGNESKAVSNAVSVGNDTLKRKIVNVSDGVIDNSSNDVVIGKQLHALANADDNVAGVDINVEAWKNLLGVGNNTNDSLNNNSLNKDLSNIDVEKVNEKSVDNLVTVLTKEASFRNPNDRLITDRMLVDKFDELSKKLKNDIYSSSSLAVAMANIPQVNSNKKFAIGAGYGMLNGKHATAIGISGNLGYGKVSYKVSTSFNDNKDFAVGAGINYSIGDIERPEIIAAKEVEELKALKVEYEKELSNLKNANKDKKNLDNQALNDVNNELKALKVEYEIELANLKNANKNLDNQVLMDINDELINVINDVKKLKYKSEDYTLKGYDSDEFELTMAQIQALNIMLPKFVGQNILIIGYADTQGEDKYNLGLGIKRGTKVKEYLENKGIKSIKVASMGYNMITDGDDFDDRRVEIIIK